MTKVKGELGKTILQRPGGWVRNQETGGVLYKPRFLLDMPRNADIKTAFSPNRLRFNQHYPLAVEQGEEGSEVEKNIPFKQGEPDWDLVLSHMQGERPVISKLYNQRWNFEKGMEFDGSSNAVDIGNPNELQLQDSVTLMGWINNHDTTTFGGGGVLGKHSRPGGWTSCDYAFVRRQEDSISFAVFDIHGDGGNISTYAIPPENTWFHLTGIYNRTTSTLSILINGIVVTSRELIIDDIKTNGIFKIGGEWYSEGDDPYFKGQIGNVSVWNKALTQSEIQDIMYKRLTGSEDGLVGYWPLDNTFEDGTDTKTKDLSPNANHGTLEGSPSLVDLIPVFSGADRPELAKIGDNQMICVERESENVKTNGSFSGTVGDTAPTGWNAGIISTGCSVEIIKSLYYDGETAVKFSVTDEGRALISQDQALASGVYVLSLVVEDIVGSPIRNFWLHSSGNSISISNFVNYSANGPFPMKIWYVFTFNEDDSHTFRFGIGSNSTVGITESSFIVSSLKVEKLSYPTLFHEGIRLAPSPVIPDFIPATGYIAGWVDMVKDNGHLFGGDVELYVDDDKFKGEIYGKTFEFNIPFTWDDYEREKLGFLLSWSDTNLYLDIVHGTTITRETEAKTITPTLDRDLFVGCDDTETNHTSVYFHQLVKGTKETFTNTEAKQLLADLSTGFTDLKLGDL